MRHDFRLGRIRQVMAYTVKERLDTSVLDRRAHEDRGELERAGGAADGLGDVVVGGRFVHEDDFADLFVDFCQLLDKLGPFFFCEGLDRFGYFVGYDDLVSAQISKQE